MGDSIAQLRKKKVWNVLEARLTEAIEIEYGIGSDGAQTLVVKDWVLFEEDAPEDLYCITQE